MRRREGNAADRFVLWCVKHHRVEGGRIVQRCGGRFGAAARLHDVTALGVSLVLGAHLSCDTPTAHPGGHFRQKAQKLVGLGRGRFLPLPQGSRTHPARCQQSAQAMTCGAMKQCFASAYCFLLQGERVRETASYDAGGSGFCRKLWERRTSGAGHRHWASSATATLVAVRWMERVTVAAALQKCVPVTLYGEAITRGTTRKRVWNALTLTKHEHGDDTFSETSIPTRATRYRVPEGFCNL
jgi:hypothetical protein